jgi:hypothetical protein
MLDLDPYRIRTTRLTADIRPFQPPVLQLRDGLTKFIQYIMISSVFLFLLFFFFVGVSVIWREHLDSTACGVE